MFPGKWGRNMFEQHKDLILVGLGLVGLFAGGDFLIRGAVALADRMRLPKLLIGLTIIGFGTSMPELLVSLKSVQSGATDIGVGNIVGSNIANILLIAAAGALIRPISTRSHGLRRDALVMLLATGLLSWMAWKGAISRNEGLAMMAALVVYLLVVMVLDRKQPLSQEIEKKPWPVPVALILVLAGLSGLVFGADALVTGASHIAKAFGVSDAVIGLTLVAVGTSLPELTVSVISAIRGQNELALGNVIGSNLFNILAVLGITAAVSPMAIDPAFLVVDVPVMAIAALILVLIVLFSKKIGRFAGFLGIASYGAYMAWLGLSH